MVIMIFQRLENWSIKREENVVVKVARLMSHWKLLTWILDTEKARHTVVASMFLFQLISVLPTLSFYRMQGVSGAYVCEALWKFFIDA